MGKLPPEELVKYVLSKFTPSNPRVLVGALFGEDASVIELSQDEVLVVHPDPISGAVKYLGFLSVHIPANDVAVTGVRPSFLTMVIQLPEGTSYEVLNEITDQVREASRSLGIDVVGGHTEFVSGIDRPLITSTVFGIGRKDRVVRTSGARVGDYVVMTKWAGIEGTSVLATDFSSRLLDAGVSRKVIEEASKFIELVSVVKEALLLSERRLANSMHDPTEGGIVAGVAEVAYASGVTVEVDIDSVPVNPVTREVCGALGVDPLKMLSSGSLLATVPEGNLEEALRILRSEGIEAEVIGRVVERSGETLVKLFKEGRLIKELAEPYVEDEVIKLWEVGEQ